MLHFAAYICENELLNDINKDKKCFFGGTNKLDLPTNLSWPYFFQSLKSVVYHI